MNSFVAAKFHAVLLSVVFIIVSACFFFDSPRPAVAIDGNLATTEADCRWCHGSNTSDRHHLLCLNASDFSNRNYGCMECHPVLPDPATDTFYTQLQRDCIACHGSDVVVNGDRHHILVQKASSYTKSTYECLSCHQAIVDESGSFVITLRQTTSSPTVEPVPNLPPVAEAGPDQIAVVGQTITFSASGSTDPDGVLESYSWDFGDGGGGTGPTLTYAYGTPGEYLATLTITDDKGATSQDIVRVRVDIPPQVFSDQALSITGLKKFDDPDDKGIRQDATLEFSNGNKQFQVANSSLGYSVATMKTSIDSRYVSKAALSLQVTGLTVNLPQTLRVYPYQSDGKSINTTKYATLKINSMGAVNLDVTSLANLMRDNGWMKFRIVCSSKGLSIAKGSFLLR